MKGRLKLTTKEDELLLAVQSALAKFKYEDMIGYIRHMLSFVEDSIHEKDLV